MRELSKRGNLVLGVAIGLALAGIVWISGNLWWIDTGWCLGSMVECYSK